MNNSTSQNGPFVLSTEHLAFAKQPYLLLILILLWWIHYSGFLLVAIKSTFMTTTNYDDRAIRTFYGRHRKAGTTRQYQKELIHISEYSYQNISFAEGESLEKLRHAVEQFINATV